MDLFDLKGFLDDVVDSFAAVLDLELTIINANPIARISGTGHFKGTNKNEVWKRTYTYQVIRNGEPLVVIDTTTSTFATVKDKTYYSIILYPILLNQIVEGVIVLASFSVEQQRMLQEKQLALLEYLGKTAGLISAKLAQERLLHLVRIRDAQLSSVFESVKGGMLLCTNIGQVLQINRRAKQLLRMEQEPDFFRLSLLRISEIVNQVLKTRVDIEQELSISHGSKNIRFIVNVRPVSDDIGSALCIINPFSMLQNTITQYDTVVFTNELVTINPQMIRLRERIRTVAQNTSNVLLLGESGTGKEIIARSIHTSGPRCYGPFVTVNCAAIPEALLESELFGYEEGAFTGAKKGGRIGKFMLADKGTLFLDEIGDMPLYLQAKILRVLTERKIDRIGSSQLVPVDIHIISATNKNLERLIAQNDFREDLYYRLSVISFKIPPLRDRREDIRPLVEHFIKKYNLKLNKKILGIDANALQFLEKYAWPGNVRELENCIEYMMNFEQSNMLSFENIPQSILGSQTDAIKPVLSDFPDVGNGTLKDILRYYEAQVLTQMNARYAGRPSLEQIKSICVQMGISVASYYRKMENLGLSHSK